MTKIPKEFKDNYEAENIRPLRKMPVGNLVQILNSPAPDNLYLIIGKSVDEKNGGYKYINLLRAIDKKIFYCKNVDILCAARGYEISIGTVDQSVVNDKPFTWHEELKFEELKCQP